MFILLKLARHEYLLLRETHKLQDMTLLRGNYKLFCHSGAFHLSEVWYSSILGKIEYDVW